MCDGIKHGWQDSTAQRLGVFGKEGQNTHQTTIYTITSPRFTAECFEGYVKAPTGL